MMGKLKAVSLTIFYIQNVNLQSPIAWKHINLYGYYTFEEQQSASINMNFLIIGGRN
jgi:hypothetical protein